MKTYLVDFENVKSKGLVGIDKLDKDDNVIIFYSENSDTISFEMHCQVLKAKANVEYMKVRVGGKNALDFQLSTLLGYIVAKGCNTHVFVISGDKGFDKLHDFWENTFKDAPDCKVFRTSNILTAVNFARSNMKIRTAQEHTAQVRDVLIEEDAQQDEKQTDAAEVDMAEVNAESVQESTEDMNAMTDEISDIAVDIEIAPEDSYNAAAVSAASSQYSDVPDGNGRKVDILPSQHEVNIPEENIARLIPDITDSEMQLLVSLFLSSDSKLELHNELMKRIDNERSTYLYNHIKSSYFTLKYDLTQEHKQADEKQAAAAEEKTEITAAPEEEQSENDKLAAEYAAEYEREMAAGTAAEKSERPEKSNKPDKNDKPEKSDKPAKNRRKPQKKTVKKTEEIERADKNKAAASDEQRKKVTPAEKKKLHGLLDSICGGDDFSIVVSEFNNALTSQQLYIKLMQHFGQDRGRELYKAVKAEYADYYAKPSNPKRPSGKRASKTVQSAAKIDDGDKRLRELAGELVSDDEFEKMRACVTGSDSVRSLYLSLIKGFGKKRGTAIYNNVKNEHSALLEAFSKAAAQ